MIEPIKETISKTRRTLYSIFDVVTLFNLLVITFSKFGSNPVLENIKAIRPYSESLFFYVIGIATAIWAIYRAANEIKKFKNKDYNNEDKSE